MSAHCKHYYCQCVLADELASMDYILEAVEVHTQNKTVPCRQQGTVIVYVDVIEEKENQLCQF